MRRYVSFSVLMALVLCLVGCDHATKQLATGRLRGQPPVQIIQGVVELHYVENRDIAFNLLRMVPEPVRMPLILVGGVMGLGLIALLWGRRRHVRLAEHLGFALVLAGALGNLSDRLLHGHVVDFIHVTHWPVFNAADVWVAAGAGLLILANWRERDARIGPRPAAS